MMLRNTKNLKGFTIQASDGELGTAHEFYFDDESWTIRYLTVETGGWLGGRQVLISPLSIVGVDWQAERVHVKLTKKQVENSPDINTHQPISRQHEAQYFRYYGYANYWGGSFMGGQTSFPMGFALPTDKAAKDPADSHLRSTRAVSGYHIDAVDW